MSFGEKPKGVLSVALLQLLSTLVCLVIVILTFMSLGFAWWSMITGGIFLLLFLILGAINLVLFYGLWKLKAWSWYGAIIINIIDILCVIFVQPESYIHWWYWDSFLVGISNGSITSIILLGINTLIVVYLLIPRTRTYFK